MLQKFNKNGMPNNSAENAALSEKKKKTRKRKKRTSTAAGLNLSQSLDNSSFSENESQESFSRPPNAYPQQQHQQNQQ